MKKSVLLWCFAALLCSSCGKRIVKTDMIGIVPKPLSEQLLDGTFDLNRGTEIRLLSEDSMLTHSAAPFVDAVRASLGKSLKTVPATVKRPHAINVWIEDSLPAEGYRLTIQPEAIDIIGGSPAGVFYAFQSLRQLLPLDALQGQRARTIELPAIEIVDQPHFAYRGAMLDVCRHFFTVDEVKAVRRICFRMSISIRNVNMTNTPTAVTTPRIRFAILCNMLPSVSLRLFLKSRCPAMPRQPWQPIPI